MKIIIMLGAIASTTLSINATVIFTSLNTGAVTQAVTAGDLGELGTVAGHKITNGSTYINNGTNASIFNENDTSGNGENAEVTVGTIEFTLAANGGLGYDISSVDVFSSWDGARSGQDYKLQFSIDGTIFTDVIDVAQGANSSFLSTKVTDDGGASLGTGIKSIRIIANSSGTSGAGTVFREIDIIGVDSAPIPEPSSTALIGLGGLAFILRRKR